MTVLLACLLATAFMAGLSWFVGVVHYPLFAGVGPAGWTDYHRRHSDRTALVVIAPMVVELAGAAWLVIDRPGRVGVAAAAVSLVLAVAVWILTGVAARLHTRLGAGLDAGALSTLLRVHHLRTALWSAHAVILAGMVAAAA